MVQSSLRQDVNEQAAQPIDDDKTDWGLSHDQAFRNAFRCFPNASCLNLFLSSVNACSTLKGWRCGDVYRFLFKISFDKSFKQLFLLGGCVGNLHRIRSNKSSLGPCPACPGVLCRARLEPIRFLPCASWTAWTCHFLFQRRPRYAQMANYPSHFQTWHETTPDGSG